MDMLGITRCLDFVQVSSVLERFRKPLFEVTLSNGPNRVGVPVVLRDDGTKHCF
jgi:hypothetical protein